MLDDQRDYAEETYNRDLCPGCGYSPCPGWACDDATDATDAVWRTVDTATAWLDTYHPPTDAEITMRVLKVAEEAGEAAAAWIGATGQNPRKGITHSRADVAAELADVVLAALVAVASLGIDPATALGEKAATVAARITQQNKQVQPGGYLRQDVSAGLALPNHQMSSEENAMVEPSTAPLGGAA